MPARITPAERLRRIEAALPEVVELARAVSLSVRAEPDLVRRLRLILFPRSGSWTEADLYFSPLIGQRTPDWIVLDPAFAHVLRESVTERLRAGAAERRAVGLMRRVIEQAHSQSPFEIRQEEDLIWLAIERRGGVRRAQAAIDRKLRPMLGRLLLSQSPEETMAVARWFASAARRMPAIAREAQAFALLAFASSSILGGRAIDADVKATPEMFEELSRYLPGSAKRIPLWTGLTTRGVQFSFVELRGYREIDVPHTDPVLLEARSEDKTLQVLHLTVGQPFFAALPPGDITIRTLSRDLFHLRPVARREQTQASAPRPLASRGAGSFPPTKQIMDWNKAIAYGQLVNAAYDVSVEKALVTPGYDVVASIYANDLATDYTRQYPPPVAIMGLILQAQEGGDVVIAIRGTEGIKQWVRDAKFLKMQFTRVAGAGETEDGFTNVYYSMKVGRGAGAPTVVKWLGEYQWRQPATSLTTCGHSLGGALATLLALDVAANADAAFQNPIVYTYASPRTGDEQFFAKYNQLVATTYRIVDNADLVPKLPSDPPYKHVCDAIELDSFTLIPPRIRLQPNPVCWHIMSSYLYLMSLESGGTEIQPEAECAPGDIGRGLLEQLKAKLQRIDKLADEFTAHPRRKMGGN